MNTSQTALVLAASRRQIPLPGSISPQQARQEQKLVDSAPKPIGAHRFRFLTSKSIPSRSLAATIAPRSETAAATEIADAPATTGLMDDLQAITNPQLTTDRPHGQSPDSLKHLFRRVFSEERLTGHETETERVIVCWRITRETATCLGLLRPHETLLEALEPKIFTNGAGDTLIDDPWLFGRPPNLSIIDKNSLHDAWRPDMNVVRSHLAARNLAPEHLPQQEYFQTKTNSWAFNPHQSLPLLPPLPPIKNQTPQDPDPAYELWRQVFWSTADRLNIEAGSIQSPYLGQRGLLGMDDPEKLRHFFPSRTQMIVFEQLLIEETLRTIIRTSRQRTKEHLESKYGLAAHEQLSLIKLATHKARLEMDNDIEEERALVIARLEEIIHRSRDAFDNRSELMAVKTLAIVLGLARVEADNAITEFIATAKKVSGAKPEAPQWLKDAEASGKIVDAQAKVSG